jgi:hypothetical protein
MSFDELRQFFARGGHSAAGARELATFLEASVGLRFETRYFGEERWWATSREEVASSLAPYHAELIACLDQMLDGEPVGSPLSAFRIAQTVQPLETANHFYA